MTTTSRDLKLRLLIEGINQAGPALKALGTGIQEVDHKLKQAGQAANIMAKELEAGLQRAQSTLQAVEQRIGSIAQAAIGAGMALAGFGASLIAPAGVAVKVAADFEAAITKVKAVSGATGEEFEKLSHAAEDWGAKTEFTAVQVAQSMEAFARAGFKTQDILNAIGPAINLAIGTTTDLGRATEIVSATMAQFGLQSNTMNQAMNTMAVGVNAASMDMADLFEALKYVGPVAASVGMSLGETVASIGALSQAGIKGSEAGTSLRGIIAALSEPTKEAKGALDELGVSIAYNAKGNVDAIATLARLQSAGMSAADAFQIFTRHTAAGALALGKQQEKYAEILSLTKEDTKALERLVGIQREAFNIGPVERFKSAVEGLATAMGSPLLGALGRLLDQISAVISKLTEWAKAHWIIAGALTGGVGLLGGLAIVAGGFALAIGGITMAAQQLIKAWAYLMNRKRDGIGILASLKQLWHAQIAVINAERDALMANTAALEANARARSRAAATPSPGKPTAPGGKGTPGADVAGSVASAAVSGGGVIDTAAGVGTWKLVEYLYEKIGGLTTKWGFLSAIAARFNGVVASIFVGLTRVGIAASTAAAGATALAAGLATFIAGGVTAGAWAVFKLATDDSVSLRDAWNILTRNVKDGSKDIAEAITEGFHPLATIKPVQAQALVDDSVDELLAKLRRQMANLKGLGGQYQEMMGKKRGSLWDAEGNLTDKEAKAKKEELNTTRQNLAVIREIIAKRKEGVKQQEAEAKASKETVDEMKARYALQVTLAQTDFAIKKRFLDLEEAEQKAKIAATVESEIRASAQIEAVHRDASQKRIQMVIEEHAATKKIKEEAYANERAQLEEQLKSEDPKERIEAKKKLRELDQKFAAEQVQDAAKVTEAIDQELKRQLEKRAELLKKVQDLNSQQRDTERQTADALRQSTIAAASEYDQLAMKLEDARAKLAEATSLMPTFPEKALQLAKDAQSSFAGLAQNLDALQQNMASNAQLVAQTGFKIATSGLTGVAKWKAELTEVRALILQAQAAAAEGRTKEAESLYKQVMSQAQSLATSAPEGMRAAARDQAKGLWEAAGQGLIQANAQSIADAKDINTEVATKIQEAGDLIKTEIQRQIEATQANIEALNQNTAALREKKTTAEGELTEARKKAAERTGYEPTTTSAQRPGESLGDARQRMAMESRAPSGPSADEKRRGEEAIRHDWERAAGQAERERQGFGAGPLQPGAYTGDQGDRLSSALREEIPGGLPAGSRLGGVMGDIMNLSGLGPTMKQAIDSVFDSIQQSFRNAGDVMAGALEIVEPGMKIAMAGAAAGGGEAGFYDTTKAPIDVQGLAETVTELKGALRDVQRALRDSTNVRVTVNPGDGWE